MHQRHTVHWLCGIALAFLATVLPVFPQSAEMYTIRLKARTFTPDALPTGSRVTSDLARHAMVQFDRIPGAEEMTSLPTNGIVILGGVSATTALVKIPAHVDPMSIPGVRWVGGIEPGDKLSPFLRDATGLSNVLVEGFRDVDPATLREAIARTGGMIIENPSLPPQTILVHASPSSLAAIVAFDDVCYVYPASSRIVDGASVHQCPGPITHLGPVPSYVTNGNGWDGPGLGTANVKYYFENGTPDVSGEEGEVLAAMETWGMYAAINWSAATSAGQNGTIDIKWGSGNHGDGTTNAFDGQGGVLAHCFYPSPPNPETIAGDLHFDEAETWRLGSDIDVFAVALHEVGHGLGLNHSDDTNAVMYAYYGGPISDLRPDDINGIRALYQSRTTSRTSAPIFDPVSGTYPSPLEVRLQYGNGSNQSNTRIFYTLNGGEPTPYAFEFVPGSGYIFQRYSNTIRARAFRPGYLPSNVASATYTLQQANPTVTTPTIFPAGGNFVGSVNVTMSTPTDFAVIRYTTNGSEPTEQSFAYAGAITINTTSTVKARGFRTGYSPSGTATANITITAATAPPTMSPDGGIFSQAVQVVMASTTPGVTIRYTTNGTTPTQSSSLYTAPIALSVSTTLKAVAFPASGPASSVTTRSFTIASQVATPTITPNGGNFTTTVSISLATSTPGATIRYTTNGAEPTSYSTIYTGSFTRGIGTHVIKAKGFLVGATESNVATATFQVFDPSLTTVATPTMTPTNGIFVSNVPITMNCTTQGATIRYSVGSGMLPADPTESGAGGITYTGPFSFGASNVTFFFKVKAFKTGLTASNVMQSGGLQFATPVGAVATPTITPNGGTFDNPVQVTLATSTQFGNIIYTIDGSEPVSFLPILPPTFSYSNPITLNRAQTLKTKAFRSFYSDSPVATAEFFFKCATPTVTPDSGTFVNSVSVTLASATTGGGTQTRYTLDGTEPTTSSTAYSSPISLGPGVYTLRAKTFRANFDDSETASGEFIVTVPSSGPVITAHPQGQTVNQGVDVSFSVTATGTPDPTYQWQRNGVNIPGATDAELLLQNVQRGDSGSYRVVVSNTAASVTSNAAYLTVNGSTGVTRVGGLPVAFGLDQNHPNPFNPTTIITYDVPEAGEVRLEIYSLTGARVRTLVSEMHQAGSYQVTWDGRNNSGEQVTSGMYLYRMASRDFHQAKKMLLVR